MSRLRHRRAIGGAATALVAALVTMSSGPVAAEADRLQQAIDYVFTGRIDVTDGPRLIERKGCVVLVPDPRNKRSIRYHLGRINFDTVRFEKIYSGREPNYRLDVEGEDTVVEFLNANGTVAHGHRTAQIALPGDIEQSRKAVALIGDLCKPEKEKGPF